MILFSSCSNRIINGKREGFWKEYATIEGKPYVAKGRYKNDLQVGTWKYKLAGRLVKKEKYNNEDCRVLLYDIKKRIIRSGQTRLDITDSLAHWYYDGSWTNFDSLGNVISKDLYIKGVLIEEQ